jgi:hypothetical protein
MMPSPFGHAQSTSGHAPVHAHSLRAGFNLSATIGTAPFRTRIDRSGKGRSGKYSSRQTRGDSYQKYPYHFGWPFFLSTSSVIQHRILTQDGLRPDQPSAGPSGGFNAPFLTGSALPRKPSPVRTSQPYSVPPPSPLAIGLFAFAFPRRRRHVGSVHPAIAPLIVVFAVRGRRQRRTSTPEVAMMNKQVVKVAQPPRPKPKPPPPRPPRPPAEPPLPLHGGQRGDVASECKKARSSVRA